MPQIINTNIASINAQRNLNTSQSANQTALQRLSSGLRINSAKDDAAGLAVSTRFTSQVRGLTVAIRNAGDGVSLAQTAEGALGAMTDNLLRIRDLALQSANATNSAVDRQALNEEVQQLKAEIQRIAEQSNFNGTKLLDGTFEDVTFQIGANEGESVTFGIASATVDELGTASTDGITSNPGQFITNGSVLEPSQSLTAGDLVIRGIAVPASTGLDDIFSSDDNEASAIAKAAAVNSVSELTDVTAIVNETSVGGTAFVTPGADTTDTIVINGISITLSISASLSDQVNLQNVVTSVNEKSGQTGVVASFSGDPATGITLTAEDGRNIIIEDGALPTEASVFGLPTTEGAATGETSRTYVGTYTLVSSDGGPIGLDTTSGDIDNAGFQVGEFSGGNSGAISDVVSANAMANGDIVINGVPVGNSLSSFDTASPASSLPETSAIAKTEAINRVSERTGVTAIANAAILTAVAPVPTGVALSATFDINGASISVTSAATDTLADRQRAIVDAVNGKSGQTGVMAEAFGDSYRLIAEDGRNIQIANYVGAGAANDASDIGLDAVTAATVAGQVQRGSIALLSAGKIELGSLTGNIEEAGFEVGSYGSNDSGQLVRDVDITSVDGAILALSAVDNALTQINFQRAELGAIQNRFESTINNQRIASENLTAANSRIRDADFAAETAELSRTSVLQQAGLSILAQANGQPQQVLQLLQG